MLDGTAGQDLPVGLGFRPYRGDENHGAMAAVRLGCVERDRVDVHSVVEGLRTAAEIAEASAKLEEPSKNQSLVVLDGSVVGYSTIRWWKERDDTWLYLHRGYLLPGHRGQGIGSAMLSWAEERIRQLVKQHGTARTAVCSLPSLAGPQERVALGRDRTVQAHPASAAPRRRSHRSSGVRDGRPSWSHGASRGQGLHRCGGGPQGSAAARRTRLIFRRNPTGAAASGRPHSWASPSRLVRMGRPRPPSPPR